VKLDPRREYAWTTTTISVAIGRRVSTGSAEAELWFNRGLVWSYAFYHEEAIRCFERSVAADPKCAMARWGITYALGPNYNKPWEAFDEVDLTQSLASAYRSTEAALASSAGAGPVEQALIRALAARYPASEVSDDLSASNIAYAEAMRSVYRAHPDDLDVAALFAEALMNVTPWALWDLSSGKAAPGAHTTLALEVLDQALERGEGRRHPGVLHMYIHLMEMSPHPERALHAADWLRGLVPDAGHLEHMPTHIDVLCGNYRDVVISNSAAMRADRKAVERDGAQNFYALYRSHNIHFKLYGAMFLGQSQVALEAADELIASLPEELLRV
jgi:tetratricopeptide (TPR) repeat protein